jgi:hypothetical protein
MDVWTIRSVIDSLEGLSSHQQESWKTTVERIEELLEERGHAAVRRS